MTEKDIVPAAESHVNPIIDACIRAHKFDKIEEIFQILGY